MHKIIIKPGKAKPFFHGESIVFSGAIKSVSGDPLTAELVSVWDAKEHFIGIGVFNPYSQYRVRLLSFSNTELALSLPEIVGFRLREAQKRRQVLNLPNDNTNAYRLCNSEGDSLSGVTIDVFADTAVISATAYWVELHRDLITQTLQASYPNIIWKSQQKSLVQDGYSLTIPTENFSKIIAIKENDVFYQVDLSEGQKTGFYCDQRENRMIVRSHAANRTVLDCFCYSGGFALNAAIGGAKRVVGIDSSHGAITLAEENAKFNKFTNVTFIKSKVEPFLDEAQGYDFIILDPPKLAPNAKSLPRAKKSYFKINHQALTILDVGGLLLTCSCSNAMSKEIFTSVLMAAAKKAGKRIEILHHFEAGLDHPYPKNALYGNYLKGVLLKIVENIPIVDA